MVCSDQVPVGMPGLGVVAADLSTATRTAERERPLADAVAAARAERNLAGAFTQAVSLRLPKGADVPEASRPAATVRLNAASFRAVEEARGILADLGDADRSSGAW